MRSAFQHKLLPLGDCQQNHKNLVFTLRCVCGENSHSWDMPLTLGTFICWGSWLTGWPLVTATYWSQRSPAGDVWTGKWRDRVQEPGWVRQDSFPIKRLLENPPENKCHLAQHLTLCGPSMKQETPFLQQVWVWSSRKLVTQKQGCGRKAVYEWLCPLQILGQVTNSIGETHS